MHDDVNDWKNRLNRQPKEIFVQHNLDFLSQGDRRMLALCILYHIFAIICKLPEVTMMDGQVLLLARDRVYI